jgi:hypothetical protein
MIEEQTYKKSTKDLVLHSPAWFHILNVFIMMMLNVDGGQPILQYKPYQPPAPPFISFFHNKSSSSLLSGTVIFSS